MLNRFEFVIHVAKTAKRVRQHENITSLRVDDCSLHAFRAATPGCDDEVTGKVWLFLRRFFESRAICSRLALKNERRCFSGEVFAHRILIEARRSCLPEGAEGAAAER